MPTVKFEDWETRQLNDPEFQAAAREQEPAYQVARLRILRGLTQGQLAKRIGTHQPSIARLESGKKDPDIPFLRQIAKALNARVEIRLIPLEPNQHKTRAKSQQRRAPISEKRVMA
jgi:transcriptional regulator with XRE-family HTH domain